MTDDQPYRPAFGLKDVEWAELERLEQDAWTATRSRMADGPVRRRLKRLSLVKSRPLNPPGLRCNAGRGSWWTLTDEGRKAVAWHLAAVKP